MVNEKTRRADNSPQINNNSIYAENNESSYTWHFKMFPRWNLFFFFWFWMKQNETTWSI